MIIIISVVSIGIISGLIWGYYTSHKSLAGKV